MIIQEWTVVASISVSLILRQKPLDNGLNSQLFIYIVPYLICFLTIFLYWLEKRAKNNTALVFKTWKLRKTSGHGLWCCLLLPASYLSQIFQYSVPGSYADTMIFTLVLTFSFTFLVTLKSLFQMQPSILSLVALQCLTILPVISFMGILELEKTLLIGLVGIPLFLHLLNKLLQDYEFSFSIGEAAFIAQGITVFMLKSGISMLSKVITNWNEMGTEKKLVIDGDLNIINDIIMIGGTGCFIMVLVFQFLQRKNFLEVCLVTFLVYVFPLLFFTQQFAFIWIYGFIFTSAVRIVLIVSWACLTIIGILFLNINIQVLQKTVVRKFFHILVILVFTPGMIFDPKLLYFASCVAFFLFIIIECVRTSADSISAQIIQKSFEKFLDEKDQGALVLTHIYLLVGCSLPIWLSPYFNYSNILLGLSGIISLGIGDTCASYFGITYGRLKWPGSPKTIVGTLSAIFFMATFVICLVIFGGVTLNESKIPSIACAIILTAFLEATTNQVDNLVLPLFMFIHL